MSNTLIKSTKSAPNTPPTIPIIGSPPTWGMRKVGTIRSKINRSTFEDRIRKYLRKGFDWRMYIPLHIAVVEELNDAELLLDGDHRKHMAALAFNDEMLVPVVLVKVDTEKEYHKLFWQMNMSHRTNVSAEEAFIHQYYSDCPVALATKDNLDSAGVYIFGSPEPGGKVGHVGGLSVKRGGFDRAVKDTGIDAVTKAARLMEGVWQTATKLKPELHWAFSILYADYPHLSNGSKVQSDWELWVTRTLGSYTQDKTATDFKTKGGNVHHRAAESIAVAILQDYRSSDLRGQALPGACSPQHKQKFTKTAAVVARRDR